MKKNPFDVDCTEKLSDLQSDDLEREIHCNLGFRNFFSQNVGKHVHAQMAHCFPHPIKNTEEVGGTKTLQGTIKLWLVHPLMPVVHIHYGPLTRSIKHLFPVAGAQQKRRFNFPRLTQQTFLGEAGTTRISRVTGLRPACACMPRKLSR